MPVFVEAAGGRPMWTEKRRGGGRQGFGPQTLRIALVNSMPDAALADTETQFFDLLNEASNGLAVQLKLVSLPQVPRGERGLERLQQLYYGVEELWNHAYDAIIVTGTEPQQPDLRQEPYWAAMTSLFDWAHKNTISTILSCLAAHAGVLHSDGISRVRLPGKMFGVFDFPNVGPHTLTSRSGKVLRFPHSRWNGLSADALSACGYQVLTQNEQAGVDCFVKRKEKSLVVHFQGHPEYQAETLFKEYRRDVRRYLRGERESYPGAPFGYFSGEAAESLTTFQQNAMSNRSEETMNGFPEALLTSELQNGWHDSAVTIYRTWLQFVSEKKSAAACFVPVKVRRSGNAVRYAE